MSLKTSRKNSGTRILLQEVRINKETKFQADWENFSTGLSFSNQKKIRVRPYQASSVKRTPVYLKIVLFNKLDVLNENSGSKDISRFFLFFSDRHFRKTASLDKFVGQFQADAEFGLKINQLD